MDYQQEYFDFLDDLRESGRTNMFGAAPYLQEHFGISELEAKSVLLKYIQLSLECTVRNLL